MRTLLDALTRLVAWSRRKHVYHAPEPVKLNLGSGLTVAPGWINIDSSLNALVARLPKPSMFLAYKLSSAQRWYSFPGYVALLKGHAFVHHDLAYGIPFPDNSCDCVYSAHFIEHLYRSDGERLFREAHRVLRPNGTLRLNIPSFEDTIASYQAGETEKVLRELFPEKDGWYSRHRCMYDYLSLERALREAGFTQIVRCKSAQGSVSDLGIFEGRRSANGLYVEAKPS